MPNETEGESLVFVYAEEETGALLRLAERVAAGREPLLVRGETGTGKEVLARLIQGWSARTGSFVSARSGKLDEFVASSQSPEGAGHPLTNEAADETVGFERAVRTAQGGTLFLDEVAALSVANQERVLRLIEHGEFAPPSQAHRQRVDVRVICTTRRRLSRLVREGRFLKELFERLEASEIEIPPLRERRGDIVSLARHFLAKACSRQGRRSHMSAEALEMLREMPLKGNARELRSIIERLVLLVEEGETISAGALELLTFRQTGKGTISDPWADFSLREEVLAFEARFIRRALKEAEGSITRAAQLLGFRHHGSLAALLSGRHKKLLKERRPVQQRYRSIIRK